MPKRTKHLAENKLFLPLLVVVPIVVILLVLSDVVAAYK